MAHKDLRACLSLLRQIQASGTLNQVQMEAIERAIKELRRIKRSGKPAKQELYRVARLITENLWEASQNAQGGSDQRR